MSAIHLFAGTDTGTSIIDARNTGLNETIATLRWTSTTSFDGTAKSQTRGRLDHGKTTAGRTTPGAYETVGQGVEREWRDEPGKRGKIH
jgi:hypothetical protein